MSNKHKYTLEEIFHPKSAAVVGVSPNQMGFAAQVVVSLLYAGFPAVYPVNPKYKDVFGVSCYPSVSAIPYPVDHVVVSVPAAKTLDLLDDCARKGVKSVHFFTAGYRETGEEDGQTLEAAMLQKAKDGGFRIIGPNCTGMLVPEARFIVSEMPMVPGPVAFLSQSGGHSMDMPFHAERRGISFSKVMSYGNALDINECELLEYFMNDEDSQIIAIYIEGVRDGLRFHALLKEAARKKPVVIYKGGISEAGLRAAQSHTASMTSSVGIFEAVCRQVNAITVNDITEMVDVLVALRFARPYPSGRGIAVVGLGGSPSVWASDRMEQAGLRFPPFSPDVRRELGKILPIAGGIFSNPLDATNIVQPDIMYQAVKAISRDPSIHMMLYHMGLHPVTRWGRGGYADASFSKPAAEALRKAHAETQKPVLLVLGPPSTPAGAEEMFRVQDAFVAAGLPVFHSLEKAALAMARVEAWHRRSTGT
ncbi:MAG: CoA-binding protein [Deltaproteobacteria bacterium]|nr:CoA-binding protein [Deltaproteobacteria bacterium]